MLNTCLLQLRVATDITKSGPLVVFTGYWNGKTTRNADGSERCLRIRCYMFYEKRGVYLMKYLKKGDQVIVEGTLENTEFIDEKGVKNMGVELYIKNFEFMTRAPKKVEEEAVVEEPSATLAGSKNLDMVDIKDDDLPF